MLSSEQAFNKGFAYNWTVNPDNPGLADYFLFSLKYACVGLFVYSIQPGQLEISSAILAPLLEEQARVTWMYNARDSSRAGMKFAALIATGEFLLVGHRTGGFSTFDGFTVLVAVRALPSICHFLYSLIVGAMLRRKINVVVVWMTVASIHWIYNELLAEDITNFIETLARS